LFALNLFFLPLSPLLATSEPGRPAPGAFRPGMPHSLRNPLSSSGPSFPKNQDRRKQIKLVEIRRRIL